jgi:RNA polymerase sigma-70 factor (ECF subfamily)
MEKRDDNFYIEKIPEGQPEYYTHIVEKYQGIVFSIALKVLKIVRMPKKWHRRVL